MSGLENLSLRLKYLGGNSNGRMNNGKLRSFKDALKDSYQSTTIRRYDGEEFECLINPDQIKPDYDNKIISIDNIAGFKVGDTLYCPINNTYWIVYLSQLTETAYFRGYIRRCRYKLTIAGSDYYVYIQGPTEGNITWSQSSGISFNKLNGSLVMYVAKTPESLDFFQRFAQIDLGGQTWRVVVTDNISMPGLIEVRLEEYFNNSLESLQNVPVVIPIDISVPHIIGDAFVRPYDTLEYLIALAEGGTWSISNTKAEILTSDATFAKVKIVSGKSGSFNLVYSRPEESDIILMVTIESL